VSEAFDLSASDNLMAPSVPILLPALSQNEMKQQHVTADIKRCERCV
jgi:hypothetical protein